MLGGRRIARSEMLKIKFFQKFEAKSWKQNVRLLSKTALF